MVGMTSTPPPSRPSSLDPEIAARLKRSADGLVPAIAQQYDTGEVLMLGWMDDEALHRTLTTGRCTYWSRSRQEYWVKGDTSGHVQHVKSVALDCDADTLLVRVDQVGAACHTGARTCFDADVLLKDPVADPKDSSTGPKDPLADPRNTAADVPSTGQ
jgi:phosphoribosyl-AMP cyclohydrolase